jgi:tetratricopeptide (TPR) repeat protein
MLKLKGILSGLLSYQCTMQGIKLTIMSEQSEKLRQRAMQARRENRPEEAKRDLIDALALCREMDEIDLAKALTGLGQIERDLHHDDVAIKHYQAAADIYRKKGNSQKLARTIRHVGDIYRNLKRTELAEPCYREALELYRRDENTLPLNLANALRGYAILKDDAGESLEAKALWEEAHDLYAAVEVEEGVAESSRRLALLDKR